MALNMPEPDDIKQAVANTLRRAGIAFVFVAEARLAARTHIAVLVSEEDAARARSVTRRVAGAVVNFFTLAGAKSGGFRLDNPKYSAITLAIFPLETADFLLDHAARPEGLDPLDEFRVAAYVRSYFGSPARLLGLTAKRGDSPHLAALAKRAGLDPHICKNRETLEECLASAGWRPPIDMLERLGLADPWIRKSLMPKLLDDTVMPAGLTVFFLRALAVELGSAGAMKSAIENAGFEVLHSKTLEGEQATLVHRSVRGGNWGAGPWPVNGGSPVQLLFAVDVFPVRPSRSTRAQHPFLDNSRILRAKIAARDAALAGIPSTRQFNALHSADNSAETLRFAKTVLTDAECVRLEKEFMDRLAEIDAAVRNVVPLSESNTVANSFRTKSNRKPIVRKVYRRQYLDSLQCDAEILERLAPEWPEVPALRNRGVNFLEFDDFGDDYVPMASIGAPLPVAMVLRVRKILQKVVEAGYDPIGWDPGQGVMISLSRGEFRIPGFDRLKRRSSSLRLANSSCLSPSSETQRDMYGSRWYPVLGIPRAVFLVGGPMTMRLYRLLIHPLWRGVKRLASASELAKARLRGPVRAFTRVVCNPR